VIWLAFVAIAALFVARRQDRRRGQAEVTFYREALDHVRAAAERQTLEHSQQLFNLHTTYFSIIQRKNDALDRAAAQIVNVNRLAYIEHHDVGLYVHPNGCHSEISGEVGRC
jgi:hypothetical protein